MFNQKKIQEISQKSKIEKWAYPRTALALKEAGVDYYIVELSSNQIVYHGNGKSFSELISSHFKSLSIRDKLDVALLKNAISKHQKEKNSYLDFLEDIMQAGVGYYRADMLKKEVAYFSKNGIEKHIEKIP